MYQVNDKPKEDNDVKQVYGNKDDKVDLLGFFPVVPSGL